MPELDEIKKELTELKNEIINRVNIDVFIKNKYALFKNVKNYIYPSFCNVYWYIFMGVRNKTEKFIFDNYGFYFRLYQEELDDLYKICIEGNRKDKTLANTSDDELKNTYADSITEYIIKIINSYFDIILSRIIPYQTQEDRFIKLMTTFGEKHMLTEAELVDFSQKAYSQNYDVSNCKTVEELEIIYDKIYKDDIC